MARHYALIVLKAHTLSKLLLLLLVLAHPVVTVPTQFKVRHTVRTAHLEPIAVKQHHRVQTAQLALTLRRQMQPAHLFALAVKLAHSHMRAHRRVQIAWPGTSH